MIQFDTSEGKHVIDVLGSLSGADLFEPLDELGERFIAKVRLGFRKSQTPYGSPWDPLKSRAGKPLLDTGRLQKSFVHSVNLNGQLRIGSNLIYASTHNEGREAGEVAHVFKGAHFRNAVIPKRQMIPGEFLPRSWADDATQVINSYLQEISDRAAS